MAALPEQSTRTLKLITLEIGNSRFHSEICIMQDKSSVSAPIAAFDQRLLLSGVNARKLQ